MIYVVELPEQRAPSAWFSFDEDDLARKLLLLQSDGVERIVYWNEAEAVAAKARAEAAIRDRTDVLEMAEAQAELARAIAQLRMIQRLRSTKG